jgi:hypothetical protein
MTRAFEQAGVTVGVDAPEADLRWLGEFLLPAYRLVDAERALGSGGPLVRVAIGPPPPAVDERPGVRVLFAFDAGPVRSPEAPIPGGTRFRDTTLDVVFDVAADGRESTIRFAPDARPAGRLALMRVVREHAHNHMLRTGGVVLHAAAVVTRAGALALAGPRTAGKTTLLLRLLAEPDVGYLANDRVAVTPPGGPAYGIPTVVALRPGTRALLPALTARLAVAGDFHLHSGERAGLGPSGPSVWRDSWYFAPRQLCAALGREAHDAAPLAGVGFIRATRGHRTRVRRLSEQEAGCRLPDALLCHRSRRFVSDVFSAASGQAPDAAVMADRCRQIAARVACFEIAMGEELEAGDGAEVLRACLP